MSIALTRRYRKFHKWLGNLLSPRSIVTRIRKPKEKIYPSFGQFTDIKSLLDTLDTMFEDIDLLKPKKSQMQRLVKRYGPFIGSLSKKDDPNYEDGDTDPHCDGIDGSKFEAGFKAYGLPSMLISYFNRHWSRFKDNEAVSNMLVCQKVEKIPFFKIKPGCAYYDCVYVFLVPPERGHGKAKPWEIPFYIMVNIAEETAEAYPSLGERETIINGKKVCGKQCLYYPDFSSGDKDADDEYGTDWNHPNRPQAELREHCTRLFYLHYNRVMRREMGINIIVKKQKHRATVIIPPNMWKDFFQYREHVFNKNGNKKRIFHAVSSHTRERKGKWWQFWIKPTISNVKTHYRGLRYFRWKSYDISIVLPGKHAVSQASFDIVGRWVANKDKKKYKGNLLKPEGKKVGGVVNKLFEGEHGG